MTETPPKPAASIGESRSLRLACLVTLIGLVMWVYSAISRPGESPVGSTTPASSSLAQPRAGTSIPGATRTLDQASAALFRLGSSFVAGFVLAWLARKFIKVAVLAVSVLGVGAYAIQRMGIGGIDSDSIHQAADRSLAWFRGEAGSFKDFVMGYVPSSASAIAGMAFGARRG